MDLKGISWVGNFYEKFEAMCLEVEETMYQDTVKFVENQVQTVGSSVKRFYSDVMQDLLPPSPTDAAKGGNFNLPLDFYGEIGIDMKPKMGLKEKHTKSDDIKKVTGDQKKITHCNSNNAPTRQRVGHVDNLFPLSEEDFLGGASRENIKESLSNKSNLRTRKSFKREDLSVDDDMKKISSFHEPSNENCQGNSSPLASRQNVEGRKSNEVSQNDTHTPSVKCNSFKQEAEITSPRFAEETATDSIEESGNGNDDIVSEKVAGIPTNENGIGKEVDVRASSGSTSLEEKNAVNVFTNDGATSIDESCSNWQEHCDEIACVEDFLLSSVESSNGWNTEVNEVETPFSSEMEVIQQVDNTKLEESCIVVNREDFHFGPSHEGKSKSYQKKIRNVFSPRKSSTRKHEYEQLALWPTVKDATLKKGECARNSIPSLAIKDGKRSSTADEGEWELL